MLPFGDWITVPRAVLAIKVIVALCVGVGVACTIVAASSSFSLAASVTIGTIMLALWLLGGALWLWYT